MQYSLGPRYNILFYGPFEDGASTCMVYLGALTLFENNMMIYYICYLHTKVQFVCEEFLYVSAIGTASVVHKTQGNFANYWVLLVFLPE